MNYAKKQVGKGLHIPQMADKARGFGVDRISDAQSQFPVLNQRLPPKKMSSEEREKLIKRIEKVATGLDNIFPWSPIPIGIGSLLGFVPFVGGAMGSILSTYQIYLSALLGIPYWLLLRMLANIAIAFLLSLIPMVGGLFHMFYRSNIYNYEELSKWLEGPREDFIEDIKPGQPAPSAASTSNTRKKNT